MRITGLAIFTIIIGLSDVLAQQSTPGAPPTCSLQEAIDLLAERNSVRIAYRKSDIPSHLTVRRPEINEDASASLARMLTDTDLQSIRKGHQLIIRKRHTNEQLYSLSGNVSCAESGEFLAHASVYCAKIEKVVFTDLNGQFALQLPAGTYQIRVDYVGKAAANQEVQLHRNRRLDFPMAADLLLEEVIVDERQTSTGPDVSALEQRNMSRLAEMHPGGSGELDVLRAATILPGIESASGMSGSLFVRGGSNDQNLVLLDGATIYNHAHLMGMHSIFDSRVTEKMQVTRAGFDPRHGGRLSSVMDIEIRKGSRENLLIGGNISAQSFGASVEGPLFNHSGSFILHGRGTLSGQQAKNILHEAFYQEHDAAFHSAYHDLTFKLDQNISENSRLQLTAYSGRDKISGQFDDNDTSANDHLEWGNSIVSARWQQKLGQFAFLNVHYTHSDFKNHFIYTENTLEDDLEFYSRSELSSVINEHHSGLSIDFSRTQNYFLRAGGGLRFQNFAPYIGAYEEELEVEERDNRAEIDESFTEYDEAPVQSLRELYFFLENRMSWYKWNADLGMRVSHFHLEDAVALYVQPRISISFAPDIKNRLFVSIDRMIQPVHHLATSTYSLPRDLWLPADGTHMPSESWQYDLGYERKLRNGSFGSRLFYKKMEGLVRLGRSGFDVEDIEALENDILGGQGWSYGLELSAEREVGMFNLFAAYTLSKSERLYDGLNFGRKFEFQYDRRHSANIVLSAALSNRLSLSIAGMLNSGNPRIDALGSDLNAGIEQRISPTHGTHSAFTAAQHRVDLSARYEWGSTSLKHGLHFSIYNIYNKSNPVFYVSAENSIAPKFNIPFTPTIRYSIQFGK